MLSFFLEGQTRRGWLDLSFDDSVTFGQARILPRCGCFDCRPPNNNTHLPAPASASHVVIIRDLTILVLWRAALMLAMQVGRQP